MYGMLVKNFLFFFERLQMRGDKRKGNEPLVELFFFLFFCKGKIFGGEVLRENEKKNVKSLFSGRCE